MTQSTKILSVFLFLALCFTSCSDENECTIICPAGQVLTQDCLCVVTDPCAGVVCDEGQILTADCDCINNTNTSVEVITKTGDVCDEVWSNDNIYLLNGKVVVREGCTLTIEPGTIIKAEDDPGTLASALIISRGAQLLAEGTNTKPIIFTSVNDEIMPGEILSPNLNEFDNKLWGGLIVLGRAPVSVGDGDDVGLIEGLPAGETFGLYGGSDPADNSGIIKYVSVRHGGISIGADNEINGITFGGVGSGTVVENIEVVANLDDGVEWFGGTVNCRNVVVAYGEDDGLDIDQNYAGTISNAFVITSGATAGDNAFEIDGPEGSLTDGFFTIENATVIDKDGGADTAADLKSRAQGTLRNISWQGLGDNVKIRQSCEESDCSTTKSDSYQNYIDGLLVIENSEWVGSANFSDWITVYGDRDCPNDERCNISQAQQDAAIAILQGSTGNAINGTATTGADSAPFAGWSWVALTGNL